MRALAFVLLALAVGVAGCGTAITCPATNAHARADSAGTQDIHVTLQDGTPAVVHMGKARVYRGDGDSCTPTTTSAIYIGSELDLRVDAWKESYPLQGDASIVILRS